MALVPRRAALIKEFLLGYWRDHHAASGYNADYAVGGGGDWTNVPMILCRLLPGDTDVHALVWDIASIDISPAPSLRQRWCFNGSTSGGS